MNWENEPERGAGKSGVCGGQIRFKVLFLTRSFV